MKVKIPLLTVLFSLFSILVFSQNKKNQATINQVLKSGTIEEQFNTLIDKSNDFQEYKNLKHYNLNRFRKNFKDSLKATKLKFDKANATIESQKKNMESLQNQISDLNKKINDISVDKDTVDFFGMRLTKTSYNAILWSLILAFLATALFFLFRFKSSNAITKAAKKSLAEIEEEFETHRKKALEREQILRRQLQDEINKQRNV